MNHAFLITAYKNPKQLVQLINQLNSEHSFFYIHLDKKSSLLKSIILSEVKNRERVFFVENAVKVYWGGFSHLKAFILLMKEAALNKKINFYHTISGQCFPICSVNEMTNFLNQNPNSEFLSYAPLSEINWTGGSFNRIQLYHLNDLFNIQIKFWKRINSRFLQLQRKLGVKRKLPNEIKTWYAGGTWWSLSVNSVNYVLNFLNEHPNFLSRFKHTHCSEEIFFQTILLNSDFKKNCVSNDLRYIDWNTRNGNCPANLDESDFEKIKNSKKLFARKMEIGISDSLIQKLIN